MSIKLPNPMMAEESCDFIDKLFGDLEKKQIVGDIVEAGCNNGVTSLFLASIIKCSQRKRVLHCYDMFAPIPSNYAKLSEERGQSCIPLASVDTFMRLFSEYPDLTLPTIHKGPFSDTMPKELPVHIAFALLDSDYYVSIKHSLSCVIPRLSKGGIIAVHDWEQVKWGPGVQKAVKEIWQGDVYYKDGLAIIRP